MAVVHLNKFYSMRHTHTHRQASKQANKHTHIYTQAATLSHSPWQVLTTICACGKRRVKAEAASHAEAAAGAAGAEADVLEPYLCLRLVLVFYLFALFVCAVCLPQQST